MRLQSPATTYVAVHRVGEDRVVVEVHDQDLRGVPEGDRACGSARSVRVVRGRTMGAPVSRILIRHEGIEPMVAGEAGRLRLAWVGRKEARPTPRRDRYEEDDAPMMVESHEESSDFRRQRGRPGAPRRSDDDRVERRRRRASDDGRSRRERRRELERQADEAVARAQTDAAPATQVAVAAPPPEPATRPSAPPPR
ncbi:MAG: hypothetical protein AAF533_11410, partial [Acidobacteriota bacterium]